MVKPTLFDPHEIFPNKDVRKNFELITNFMTSLRINKIKSTDQ